MGEKLTKCMDLKVLIDGSVDSTPWINQILEVPHQTTPSPCREIHQPPQLLSFFLNNSILFASWTHRPPAIAIHSVSSLYIGIQCGLRIPLIENNDNDNSPRAIKHAQPLLPDLILVTRIDIKYSNLMLVITRWCFSRFWAFLQYHS